MADEYTDLISKTVFLGFIAAWFLADSPINRSFSVKETNDGVVKLPCSLATVVQHTHQYSATNKKFVPCIDWLGG